MRLLPILAAASAAVGCQVGTTPRTFQPAASPAGVTVTLALPQTRFEAELLALDDSALIVRRLQGSDPVAFVRFAAIRESQFRQVSVKHIGRNGPGPADRERLRLVSRFPQGLTPELLRRLLEAHAQPAAALY